MKPVSWAVCALGLTLLAPGAQARPEYAMKEGKKCAFCHVNPMGGGARNKHGLYYFSNNKSLVGLPPEFKLAWTEKLAGDVKRVHAADTVGNGKTRLIVLHNDGKMTIHTWSAGDKKFADEASFDVGKAGDKFHVGNFDKSSKAAIIIMPGAFYTTDGGATYTKKAVSDLADITGFLRYMDGTENVFFFDGSAPSTYALDVKGEGNKALKSGGDLGPPDGWVGQFRMVAVRGAPDLLAGVVPPGATAAGTAVVWDARKDGKLNFLAGWEEKSGEKKGVYVRLSEGVVVTLGGAQATKVLWESPKIEGKLLDIAPALDPKDGKTDGILVLSAPSDKETVLQFFALE